MPKHKPKTDSPRSISYTLCDDASDLAHLTSVLDQSKSHIILDCEGRTLGDTNGKLGLIQLGINNEVYLIDVISFPSSIKMLKPYLESTTITKYVWDGRCDYSELKHGHGITLKGVVDLQLADVHSEIERQEKNWNVHRLSSLKAAAEKWHVLPPSELAKIKSAQQETKDAMNNGNSDLWISRPLPESFLSYASYDIKLISSLLPKLQHQLRRHDLKAESKRYLELNQRSRSNRGSKYHSHGFLPQEIVGSKVRAGATKLCPGCNRRLHQASFYTYFHLWDGSSFTKKLCFTCFRVHSSDRPTRSNLSHHSRRPYIPNLSLYDLVDESDFFCEDLYLDTAGLEDSYLIF